MTWYDHAACRDHTYPNDWFADPQSKEGQTALSICRTCPVGQQCLQEALTKHHRDGIWGGLTPQQRARHT